MGKWLGFSFFPSGNGKELSPLILFLFADFFSPLPQEREKDLTEDTFFSLIRFQLYFFFKAQTSLAYRPAMKYALVASCRTLHKDPLRSARAQFTADAPGRVCDLFIFNPNRKSAI